MVPHVGVGIGDERPDDHDAFVGGTDLISQRGQDYQVVWDNAAGLVAATERIWKAWLGNGHENSVYVGWVVVFFFVYVWKKRDSVRLHDLRFWYVLAGVFAILSLGPVLNIAGRAIQIGPVFRVMGKELAFPLLPYAVAWVVFPPLRLSGVPVNRILLLAYAVSGALAGLGGVVMASQLKSGAPTYGQMYELYVIAAVVVGGTSLSGGEGQMFGTLLGALLIAVIQNGMNLTGGSWKAAPARRPSTPAWVCKSRRARGPLTTSSTCTTATPPAWSPWGCPSSRASARWP